VGLVAPFLIIGLEWKKFTTPGSLYYFYEFELEFRTIALIMASWLLVPALFGLVAILVETRRPRIPSRARSKVAAALVMLAALAIGYNYFPALPYDLGWLMPEYGPYIQYGSDDSMLISWDTSSPKPSLLEWGTSADALDAELSGGVHCDDSSDEPGYHHCVRMVGLTPGQRYHYRVPGLGDQLHSFRAAHSRESGESVVFAVMADTQLSARTKRRIIELMEQDSQRVDFAIIAGDVVHWDNGYAEWNEFFAEESFGGFAAERPVMVASGNHELYCAPLAPDCQGRRVFELKFQNDHPHGGRVAGDADRVGYYYSFEYSNVHVAILDNFESKSGPKLSAAQLEWLKADLAASRGAWKFLVFHIPLYTLMAKNQHPDFISQLEPIIDEYAVDALFYGHEHVLQVFRRPDDGALHFLTGGGGGTLAQYHYPRWGDSQWPQARITADDIRGRFPNAHARDWFVLGENSHHYMKVGVTGDRATFTIYRLPGGDVIEEFVAARRGDG
jgi:predicted phosphodiesterase